jgi:hypothetical protein
MPNNDYISYMQKDISVNLEKEFEIVEEKQAAKTPPLKKVVKIDVGLDPILK